MFFEKCCICQNCLLEVLKCINYAFSKDLDFDQSQSQTIPVKVSPKHKNNIFQIVYCNVYSSSHLLVFHLNFHVLINLRDEDKNNQLVLPISCKSYFIKNKVTLFFMLNPYLSIRQGSKMK